MQNSRFNLKVEVIGTGGAFNTDKTNSSFLVHLKGTKILVDCGYNVFPYLKQKKHSLLDELDIVAITHLDDDHIGSLRSLIFYRWFIVGKKTTITANKKILKDLKTFLPKESIWNYKNPSNYKGIKTVRGEHHIDSFGFMFWTKKSFVYISGDTKATKHIEKTVTKKAKTKDAFLLHDYSYYSGSEQISHMTESNMKQCYTKGFYEELNFYHNEKSSLSGCIFKGV